MEDDVDTMDGDNTSVSSTERRDEALRFKSESKPKVILSRGDDELTLPSSGGQSPYRLETYQSIPRTSSKSRTESDHSQYNRTRTRKNFVHGSTYSSTSSAPSPTKRNIHSKLSYRSFHENVCDDSDSSPTLLQRKFEYSDREQHCFTDSQNVASASSPTKQATFSSQEEADKCYPQYLDEELSEKIKDIDRNLLGLVEEHAENEKGEVTQARSRRLQKAKMKSTDSSKSTSTEVAASIKNESSNRSSPILTSPSTREPDSSPHYMLQLPNDIRLHNVAQKQSMARVRRRFMSCNTSPEKETPSSPSSPRPATVDNALVRKQLMSDSSTSPNLVQELCSPGTKTRKEIRRSRNSNVVNVLQVSPCDIQKIFLPEREKADKTLEIQGQETQVLTMLSSRETEISEKDCSFPIPHTAISSCGECVRVKSPKLNLISTENLSDISDHEIRLNFPHDMISSPNSSKISDSGHERDEESSDVTPPGCIVTPRKVRLPALNSYATMEERVKHKQQIPDIPEEIPSLEETKSRGLLNVFLAKNATLKNIKNDMVDDRPSVVANCQYSTNTWFSNDNNLQGIQNNSKSRPGNFSGPSTVTVGKPITVDIAQVISRIQERQLIQKTDYDILIKNLEDNEGGDISSYLNKAKSKIMEAGPSKVDIGTSTMAEESDESTVYSVSILEPAPDVQGCLCLRTLCEGILNLFFSPRR